MSIGGQVNGLPFMATDPFVDSLKGQLLCDSPSACLTRRLEHSIPAVLASCLLRVVTDQTCALLDDRKIRFLQVHGGSRSSECPTRRLEDGTDVCPTGRLKTRFLHYYQAAWLSKLIVVTCNKGPNCVPY